MSHNLFESEDEMQQWFSNFFIENDCLADLICNLDEYHRQGDISIAQKRIADSYEHCLASMNIVSVISENENISLKSGDVLKPDFLLYAPETESIIILELKNMAGPSRQVATEVSAYASEIKSYIPFISDGDIITVIVSPVYTVLARHYIFHEIFWLQRNILCLQPCLVEEQIMLKIVDPKEFIDNNYALKLSSKHLGGYQICLYDDQLYTNEADRTRLDPYLEQMKTAISVMASKGNSQRNHGFAFLWKDNWELSLAPYSITVLNFAPLQSLERLFHDDGFQPNEITERFIRLIQEYDPIGHGNSLNEISKSGTEFLKGFCSPMYEGFDNWNELRELMLPRSELIAFYSWGIFSELYSQKILHEYESGNRSISSTDPHLGLSLIDELVDSEYEFIDLALWAEAYEDDGDVDDEEIEKNDEFKPSNDLGSKRYDDLPF